MEEVAVELRLLPLVGLLAGVLRLKLDREKQGGVLRRRQVADFYAGTFQIRFYAMNVAKYLEDPKTCIVMAAQTSIKSCRAAALLRAEQGPCEPNEDFVNKFEEL